MDKNELIRLLASMNVGELQEIYSAVKQYTASAETIDSLKQVYDNKHLIEFVTEDGNMILTDKFISATPIDEHTVRVQFSILGIVCDYQLAVDIDVTNKWVLNSRIPFYDFGNTPIPSYIVKFSKTKNGGSKLMPFIPIKGLTVCKLVHNCYDTETSNTGIESNTRGLLEQIKTKISNKKSDFKNSSNSSDIDKISNDENDFEDYVPPIKDDKSNIIEQSIELTHKWINRDDSHRIVFCVSRAFNYKDDKTSGKSTNHYSSVFDTSEWVDEKKYYYFSSGGFNKKGVYSILNPSDFIDGSVEWDYNRKNLVIMNADKNYIIRISYMKDSVTLDLDKEQIGLDNVFSNLS